MGAGGSYGYDEEDLEWFEQFDLRPIAPGTVSSRLEDGAALETVDLPEYLARPLRVDADTGLAMYRLTQLFGTPNVEPLMAGADQPDRSVTTWLYLFEVTYDPDDGEPREFLQAIYDYKTDVSTGLSGFVEDEAGAGVRQPSREPKPGIEVYEDDFLVGLIKLALNVIEEPVPATFKDLWV